MHTSTQINFDRRHLNSNGSVCLMTLDGTDFIIQEPKPFNPGWRSHKHNGSGIHCEIGICIQTAEIVWVNGPHACGSWPDLRVARNDIIIFCVDPTEMILADGGCSDGDKFFVTPTGNNNPDQRMKAAARARHETVNRRFKIFAGLKQDRAQG